MNIKKIKIPCETIPRCGVNPRDSPTLTISLWKSGTIALSVCAVFACVNSLSRAVSAAIIRNLQLPPDGPWLCLGACVFYNAVCWVIVLAAYYPATHTVRAMVEDDNFAQTWYVFWVLPLAFILLNLFMIPRYQSTLQTGRVLQGYPVRHPYCGENRRHKYLYPSERRLHRQSHALRIREYSEHIPTTPGATNRSGPGGCPLLLRKERSNTMEQLLRQRAESIWTAAIRSVLPDEAVRRALEHFHPQGRVFLVAAGKAAWQMAHAALAVLGCVDGGIVITKYGHVRGPLPGVTCCEAGHPVPDDNSFAATQRALALVSGLRADDTVLFLLSGGGSALFEKPLLPAEELQAITQALLACGADIVEINTIRKRLSAVKGGRFALACAPAAVYSVVLSDILGDPLDMIASGPACPDSSTCAQAAAIAEKYRLALSPAAAALLRQETPKTLPNVTTKITGSVRELCRAAADACRAEGYEPILLTDCLCCEAREAGSLLGSIARTHAGQGRRRAFIAGGETVVHLTGHGLGGRNQELALAAAPALAGLRGCCVFSVGSDGTDGPTDAAGGYADGEALAALTAAGLDVSRALADNDAYHALQAVGGLIMTGPTGTNVNDVAVVLTE